MRKVGLAILSLLALAPTLFADQVTLKNGDRLSGSILTSDAKTLILKTEYAGTVTIQWDFVQQIDSSQSLYVGTKGGQVIVGPVTTRDSEFTVHTQESGSVNVPKADVTSLRNTGEEQKAEAAIERLRHPRLSDLWTGSLDTGLGLVRGNSQSSNFTFGLNAVRATTRDKITYYTTAAFARSTVNGVTATTAQTIAGGVRYDLNLTDKSFAFGTLDLFNDRFQGLDLRTVLGAGGGIEQQLGAGDQSVVGRVEQDAADLVGAGEDGIGHGLPHADAGDALDQRVHDHVSRSGVEGEHIFRLRARRNYRHIRDAADIESHAAAMRVAVKQTIHEWDKRRALSSCGHIRRTKVPNGRNAGALGNDADLPDL